MSGIDKGFLFGILTEVLRGNKRSTLNLTEEIKMRKLQIILGIIGILLGCYTMVTAIMYLSGTITNLGFCMIGLAFCCVFNCCNCLITVLNVKKDKK